MRKRIADVAALLGALALAGALLAGAAALFDGARTAHAQESGGEQQQAGAEGSGAAAELTEWQKARIAEYQDAQTAQSGVSGQAEQGMISGLASVMNKGASDQFTVSATGLDPYFYYEYVFLVNSLRPDGGNSRGGIGFDSRCNSVVTSVRAPLRAKNHSATLTLYACSAGSYQVNSKLRLINHDEDPEDPERVTTLDTDIATVTVTDGTPTPTPPAPSNFRVTSTGQTSVVLAWNAQSQISGFHISGAPRAIYPSKSSTSATASNLRCDASYTFRIRAEGDNTNTQGWSPWSSYVSATTSACPPPTITISRNRASVTEGQNAQFTLRASHAPSSNLTVNVSVTQSGSFISGTAPTSVRIASGRKTATLTVRTSDDSVDELHGSVTAQVLNGTGYTVGTSSASASVIVNDNDPIKVTISRNQSSITEGQNATFTLTATTAPSSNLSVRVSVTQSGSFISGTAPTSVRIASGRKTATLTVRTSDDSVVERNGSITASIVSQPSAGYVAGTPSFASVTVNDNDKPTVTISRGTSPITEGTSASFTLTASPAPLSNLSVRVSVSQSGAFIRGSTPTSVRIPRGQTSASFTVRTSDDRVIERNGSITARVRSGTGYNVGSPSSAKVTVNNNDHPTITIAAGTSPIAERTTAQFTLTASAAPPSNLAVSVSVTQSGSFISGTAPTSVTIPANRTTATLSVPTLKDKVNEADGSISAAVQAGTNYVVGSPSSASVSVRDTPYLSIAAGTSPITEGANATFTITAAGAPLSSMTVSVNVTQSGSFIKGTAPSSVTIPANGTSATLTVPTKDDSTDEPNGSITASISANAAYELGSPSSASVAVQDNDLPKLAAPTGLAITPLPQRKARLDWGTVASSARYQVEVRKAGGSWAAAPSGSTTSASYEITLDSIVNNGDGLAQASAYQFRVKAIASGSTHADSDYSAVVEIRDTPIASINGDSSGRTDGKGQAVVTWSAVPGATSYRLRWRELPDYQASPRIGMRVPGKFGKYVDHANTDWRPQGCGRDGLELSGGRILFGNDGWRPEFG